MPKVNIKLTDEQRKYIRAESGVEIDSLVFETLEDRDAPKRGGVRPEARVYPQINNPDFSNNLPILDDPTLD